MSHPHEILALIARSPDLGDGWRKVPYAHLSDLMRSAVERFHDLIESETRNGILHVRMTQAGLAVLKYGRHQ